MKLQDNSYEFVSPNETKRFTVDELRQIGYKSNEILTQIGDDDHIDEDGTQEDYNYDDLKTGGYTATELKIQIDPTTQTYYTAKTLKEQCGYNVFELAVQIYSK